MNKTEQVRFRVSAVELSRLDQLAHLSGRTRSDLLRLLIKRAEVVPEHLTRIEIQRVLDREGTPNQVHRTL